MWKHVLSFYFCIKQMEHDYKNTNIGSTYWVESIFVFIMMFYDFASKKGDFAKNFFDKHNLG